MSLPDVPGLSPLPCGHENGNSCRQPLSRATKSGGRVLSEPSRAVRRSRFRRQMDSPGSDVHHTKCLGGSMLRRTSSP